MAFSLKPCLGRLGLAKTCSRLPLYSFSSSKKPIVWSVSGTRWLCLSRC